MASRNPIIRRAEAQYQSEYTGPGFAAVNQPGQGQPQPGQPQPGQPQPGQAGAQGQAGQAQAGQAQAGYTQAAPSAEQLQQMYAAPAVPGSTGLKMTLNDVIMKTALNFVILLVFAVVGWATAESAPYLWIVAFLVALPLGFVNALKREVSPILVILYAVFEGVLLGAISRFYQIYGEANGNGNIVLTAVTATLVVFAVMLALYTTRIIKVTNRFARVMTVALISYLAFSLISVITMFFGVGQVNGVTFGLYGVGWFGIAISIVAVLLAAFCLCLDFEAIAQGIRYGVPERESWRMAFGLMVTLIWLYLELLRLVAIFSRS